MASTKKGFLHGSAWVLWAVLFGNVLQGVSADNSRRISFGTDQPVDGYEAGVLTKFVGEYGLFNGVGTTISSTTASRAYASHLWAISKTLVFSVDLSDPTPRLWDVTLGWSESYPPNCVNGARVFSASVGSKTESGIDVYSRVGCARPYTLSFQNVSAAGSINITLSSISENAFLSLVEIVPAGGGPSPIPTPTPTSSPTLAPGSVLKINFGRNGPTNGYLPASANSFGGYYVDYQGVGQDINGTTDDLAFESHIWTSQPIVSYTLSLTPGQTYDVILGWSESYWPNCVQGGRVFSVTVGNQTVPKIDVFVLSGGCYRAYRRTFSNVQADTITGKIVVTLTKGAAENPFLSLIEVAPKGSMTPYPTAMPTAAPTMGPDSSLKVNFGRPGPTNGYTAASTSRIVGYYEDFPGTGQAISETMDDLAFESHLWTPESNVSYTLSLAPGQTYDVILGWSESYGPNCVQGGRVFAATVGNQTVPKIDVFMLAGGCFKAYRRVFGGVKADVKGDLVVTLTRGAAQNPFLSLIEVVPKGITGTPQPTLEPSVQPTPQPTPQQTSTGGPAVTGFTLVDANTNSDLFALTNGTTLLLGKLPPINIKATTVGTIGSVKFDIDGVLVGSESMAPYALAGDVSGDYNVWLPKKTGYQTITAKIYNRGSSTPVTSLSIMLNVVPKGSEPTVQPSSSPPTPQPTVDPGAFSWTPPPSPEPTTVQPQPSPVPTPEPSPEPTNIPTVPPTPHPTVDPGGFIWTPPPSPPPTTGQPTPFPTNVPTTFSPIQTLPPTTEPETKISFGSQQAIPGYESSDLNKLATSNGSYNSYAGSNVFIVGSNPSLIYASHIWVSGDFNYTLEKSPGSFYDVTLGFAESYAPNCGIGKRVFSAAVNGVSVPDIDVFASAGCNRKYDVVFRNVQASATGKIVISLKKTPANNPFLSVIKVGNPTSVPPPVSSWLPVATGSTGFSLRVEACFVEVVGLMYLIGGRGIQPVDVYNPSTQRWTRKTGPGIELHHMQCIAVGTKVWIASAWTGAYPKEQNVGKIYVYDTTTDTWDNSRQGLPLSRQRGSSAAVYYNGDIYVSHGNSGGHGAPHSVSLGWLDKYNIANDTWTALPPAPNPRDHTGGAVVNGEFCVAAGRNGGDPNFFDAVILPTDCFNFATQTWNVKANIPQGRGGSAYGQTCDGKLMVAGGEGFGVAWPYVDVFDGTSWTKYPELVIGRHATGVAFSCECNQAHIAAGSSAQGERTVTTIETLFLSGTNAACDTAKKRSSRHATPAKVRRLGDRGRNSIRGMSQVVVNE